MTTIEQKFKAVVDRNADLATDEEAQEIVNDFLNDMLVKTEEHVVETQKLAAEGFAMLDNSVIDLKKCKVDVQAAIDAGTSPTKLGLYKEALVLLDERIAMSEAHRSKLNNHCINAKKSASDSKKGIVDLKRAIAKHSRIGVAPSMLGALNLEPQLNNNLLTSLNKKK